jgi:hypothetical protein
VLRFLVELSKLVKRFRRYKLGILHPSENSMRVWVIPIFDELVRKRFDRSAEAKC